MKILKKGPVVIVIHLFNSFQKIVVWPPLVDFGYFLNDIWLRACAQAYQLIRLRRFQWAFGYLASLIILITLIVECCAHSNFASLQDINLNLDIKITMSVPGKRNRISDDQRSILETFYHEGMVGSGSFYKAKIDRAIDETGLTEAQVKVFLRGMKMCSPGFGHA